VREKGIAKKNGKSVNYQGGGRKEKQTAFQKGGKKNWREKGKEKILGKRLKLNGKGRGSPARWR